MFYYRKSAVYFLMLVTCLCFFCCQQEAVETKGTAKDKVGKTLLRVVSYGGGSYQQSHVNAFIEPFKKSRGISVESVVWGAEYGRLLEMVRSNSVPWDVVEVTAAQYIRGIKDEIYSPLEVPISQDVFAPIKDSPGPSKYGVPNVYWSTVLAYNSKSFPNKPPTDWKDFWDIKSFPGDRALLDNPRATLEFALLADGVTIKHLYPLDVDRAFKKLDIIKPYIRLWWSDGTEPVNALLTNRVVMSSAWSGRIFASEMAKSEIKYSWSGAAHELDYWIIPKGAPNPKLASEFILFASQPKNMAVQAIATAYGPANAYALQFVPSKILPYLPTSPVNWEVSFVINPEWWKTHEQELMQKWIVWKSK